MTNHACAGCRKASTRGGSLSLGVCSRCWRRGWSALKVVWDPLDGYEAAQWAMRQKLTSDPSRGVKLGATSSEFAGQTRATWGTTRASSRTDSGKPSPGCILAAAAVRRINTHVQPTEDFILRVASQRGRFSLAQ